MVRSQHKHAADLRQKNCMRLPTWELQLKFYKETDKKSRSSRIELPNVTTDKYHYCSNLVMSLQFWFKLSYLGK